MPSFPHHGRVSCVVLMSDDATWVTCLEELGGTVSSYVWYGSGDHGVVGAAHGNTFGTVSPLDEEHLGRLVKLPIPLDWPRLPRVFNAICRM